MYVNLSKLIVYMTIHFFLYLYFLIFFINFFFFKVDDDLYDLCVYMFVLSKQNCIFCFFVAIYHSIINCLNLSHYYYIQFQRAEYIMIYSTIRCLPTSLSTKSI